MAERLEAAVATTTASEDGSVTVSVEVELPGDEAPDPDHAEQPQESNEATDVLVGVVKGAGRVLKGAWDILKPHEDPPPQEPDPDVDDETS